LPILTIYFASCSCPLIYALCSVVIADDVAQRL